MKITNKKCTYLIKFEQFVVLVLHAKNINLMETKQYMKKYFEPEIEISL